MKISAEAGALRLDFDFHGGGGFVVARKEFKFAIPDDYAFAFRVRGAAPKNTLEFKLADPSGKNVWRWQEPAFAFGQQARELVLRGSRIGFAWGPAGGGTPRAIGAIEFVLSAGPGGKGTVWIEDLRFQDRTIRRKPVVSVSSSVRGSDPASVFVAKSSWRAAAKDAAPVLALDFHDALEYVLRIGRHHCRASAPRVRVARSIRDLARRVRQSPRQRLHVGRALEGRLE
jgi:hypothetical protein